MRHHHRYSSAFTLVEILVTLGIVGILVGIALPVSNRVKRQANATKCTSNLRQIGIGMNLYLADHGSIFPTLATGRDSRSDVDTPVLETTLNEYVDQESVFHCPADHQGHFQASGSSYFWNSLINGQNASDLNFLGIIDEATGIPLVSDKENYHTRIGGEVNILYADGHVQKDLQFNVSLGN